MLERNRAMISDFVMMAFDVKLSCSTASKGTERYSFIIEGHIFAPLR